MKTKIVMSTIINIFSLAIMFAVALVMTPVILHRMGAEQYGLWAFLGIFSASGYFSLLDMGMQGTAIKYISEYHAKGDKEKLNQVINSVLLFFLIVGFAGGIILLIVNNLFLGVFFHVPPAYFQLVQILINLVAISFLFQFPAMGLSAIIEGLQRYDVLKGISLFFTIVSNAILYLYLTHANGLWFMTAISLSSSLLLTLAYLLFSKILLPEMRINPFRSRLSTLRSLSNMSVKLFISKLVGLVFNNTDKILISIFLTMTAMTYYDIVNKITFVVALTTSLMNQTLIPFTSKLSAQNDEERIRVLFMKASRYSAVISLPAIIFVMVMAKELISVWIGREYAWLFFLAQLFISHNVLTLLTGVPSTMMVGVNKVEEALKVSVFLALLNLAISIFTVSYFGIAGLIAGTVIAYLTGFFFSMNIFLRVLKTDVGRYIKTVVIRPYLVAGLLVLMLIYVKNVFVFSRLLELFILGVLSYMFYFLIYIAIDKDDREFLLSGLKKLSLKKRKI